MAEDKSDKSKAIEKISRETFGKYFLPFIERLLDRVPEKNQQRMIVIAWYSTCVALVFLVPFIVVISLISALKKLIFH